MRFRLRRMLPSVKVPMDHRNNSLLGSKAAFSTVRQITLE
jgi:hypothetical protein